jgi:cytochrome P450
MQRNPALWGDDADDFNPERWIDPNRMKKFVANPTMFTPFSAGPRIVSLGGFLSIFYRSPHP